MSSHTPPSSIISSLRTSGSCFARRTFGSSTLSAPSQALVQYARFPAISSMTACGTPFP